MSFCAGNFFRFYMKTYDYLLIIIAGNNNNKKIGSD